MTFHILTLFPEMVRQGLDTSIMGRAAKQGVISIDALDIRQFTQDKHGKADDYTYGGGAGMLMQAQPVYDAWQAAAAGKEHIRTVYVTPQGRIFDQKLAEELAGEEELVILCGHYEGIDERVLDEIVTDYISIGDYVLTGGELAAMVMVDAIARLVPGVLNNLLSAETESLNNDLLEYPQYSRPEVWHGKQVPQVLLSGNHKNISKWRLEQSVERTRLRRPDLYRKYQAKQQLIRQLSRDKRNNIHIMESLGRGRGEILYARGEDILIYDRNSKTCMMSASGPEAGRRLAQIMPEQAKLCVINQEFLKDILAEAHFVRELSCSQFLYTQKTALPVKRRDIRLLTREHLDYVCAHYSMDNKEYVLERIESGAMYGIFAEGRLAGFAGLHSDGGLGLLYVEEPYRRQGMAEALEAFGVNRLLERGWTPYCHVLEGNEASVRLQEKLGLYRAERHFWWFVRK